MLTIVLSIIGAITGFAGLAINFYKFLSERFKLKIIFSETDNIFFPKLKDSICKTNYQGIIRMNIINKSSSPVTVYDIDIFCNNLKITNRKYETNEIVLLDEVWSANKYSSLVFPMDKQFTFPLRLESYDSYEGVLFLPFFPDTYENEVSLKIVIKSTKRIIKKHCLIKKFETKIHENSTNNYI